MSVSHKGPYAGVRVLDFSMFLAGPYCARLMADMGAEVIKVEPPAGDFLRSAPPVRDGHSAYFGQMNTGKKSVALDLKQPSAVAAVKRLVGTADVLIENFRPGVMARLGLGYEVLHELRPQLVYCSVSGYGQTGPRAGHASFAPIIHAASGFDMLIPRYDENVDRPLTHRYTVADMLAATHALAGIGAALYQRHITGEGEHLDVALIDAMYTAMAYEYAAAQFPGSKPITFRPMRTRDGFIAIAPVSQGNFEALARAAGHAHWMADERFATRDARVRNWPALLGLIEAWTSSLVGHEAERVLLAEGCPASVHRELDEARLDAQAQHRGSRVAVTDAAGAFEVANCPIQFGSVTVGAGPRVPALGEHGRAVLQSVGYSPEDLEGMLQTQALL
jgi:CoA:oxalate CoA-transferase